MIPVPHSDWEWYGHASHFIAGHACRFHLATVVGPYLISTIGEYLPDEGAREIIARSRNIILTGQGDERRASYMKQIGYEQIGMNRLYETMVFRVDLDKRCEAEGCGCNAPAVEWSELDFDAYNTAGDATKGHMAMCERWSLTDPDSLNP